VAKKLEERQQGMNMTEETMYHGSPLCSTDEYVGMSVDIRILEQNLGAKRKEGGTQTRAIEIFALSELTC
jgi:hypothetical protein